MRNLSLRKVVCSSLEYEPALVSTFTAAAIDIDHDALYMASERQTSDADLEVTIWGPVGEDLLLKDQAPPSFVASFTTSAYLGSKPWSHPNRQPYEVLSFRFLPDTCSLVFVMRGGDITTMSLGEVPTVEVVGSVDTGILAAAWSPDDTLLVLVTADDKLILMTSDFDILSEYSLHTADFGEDAPINVGWGSKQTQFHGSLGKPAAQAAVPAPDTIGTSPDDDDLPRISWRGDGAFFAISALSPSGDLRRRILRTYSREGALQSTAEPVAGLEHVLSWRPSGNVIVGTQRFGADNGLGRGREGRHDVVFFERNGLRHGEFGLREVITNQQKQQERPWGYRVRELGWNADSNVLSLWIEREENDVVQLWTTGNYHWYLKHEIPAPCSTSGKPGRFTSVCWHPEDALRIILTTSDAVLQRTYAWETFASRSKPPIDSGSVAVFDGINILLTPFRTQNVPPPMSSYQLPLSVLDPFATTPRIPTYAAFSLNTDLLAVLWESGYLQVSDLCTRIGPGKGKVMDNNILWAGPVSEVDAAVGADSRVFRQVVFWQTTRVDVSVVQLAVLGATLTGNTGDIIYIEMIEKGKVISRVEATMPGRNGSLVPSDQRITWQSLDGEIYVVDPSGEIPPSSRAHFPEFCMWAEHVHVTNSGAVVEAASLFFGLSQSGKLHIMNELCGKRTLATNVNSFTLTPGFLIFTTTTHVAHFAPLPELVTLLAASVDPGDVAAPLPEWETRRVERGSKIVTVVPSAMALVLQMPRGNLETINPRPLVMEIVKQDIVNGNYGKAFAACRKHRIDLNVLVGDSRVEFIGKVSSFVEQVNDVDFINLFLTSVGQGPLPAEDVAQICDSIRMVLEKKDLKLYINSILTAHVVKSPPDHEAGLALLLKLRETEPQLVEDAVKYIIFLVDANSLFDTALGMYDFSLVLMIAQYAQKDPREYLPFLRELRALDKFYQRYRIDDYLRRYEKALNNLSLAGPERFIEAMQYVEKHRLYEYALSLWQGTDRYDDVLNVYGDWLYERREFKEAAFVFRKAQQSEKAMIAYEKALDWQELFDLALQNQISGDNLVLMGHRVAEDLSSKKRYADAARVLLDYSQDVREATIALIHGNYFSEARRIITLHSRSELLEEIIHPGALDARDQIAEDLKEMREQLRKQVNRLRDLRVKKIEEPDAFYGAADTDLHNVDVMTDISMAPTAFTRYTVAPTTASRASTKRSSRSKRKMERKVGSGRKGTVDEEEYLLKSVTKLVGRFNATQTDAANILPHLLHFTEEHCSEAQEMQTEITAFKEELKAAIEDIWKKAVHVEGEPLAAEAEDWATRMQEHEKQRLINPTDKVVKPEIIQSEWKLKLPIRPTIHAHNLV